MQFDDRMRIHPKLSKGDDKHLSDLSVDEVLTLEQLNPAQHFTKPPARFGEASLVKELEKRSIGRPSTYASIISTIQDRGYARLDKKRFYAEKMGEIVTDSLSESFKDLMNYDFTANMEQELDEVADGKANWKDVLFIIQSYPLNYSTSYLGFPYLTKALVELMSHLFVITLWICHLEILRKPYGRHAAVG